MSAVDPSEIMALDFIFASALGLEATASNKITITSLNAASSILAKAESRASVCAGLSRCWLSRKR
jgi:hypothetical protein